MEKKPQVNLARLKRLMEKKGYGIGELAEYSGVKYQTVYSLVKGRRTNTTADTLRRIADALDTSIDYLLGNIDDDKPPIEKLPEPIRQIAQVAGNLSEVRQEELLRIAGVLVDIEREQASTLAERQSRKDNAQAMMSLIEATLGEPARKAIERAMYTSGLFGGDTSDDGDDS